MHGVLREEIAVVINLARIRVDQGIVVGGIGFDFDLC